MNHVIIGNGVAAIGAIEAIRDVSKEDSITVISDEPYHVYSKPILPKLVSREAKIIWYRDEDFYKKNNITILLGKKVKCIDTDKKTVVFGQEKINYDKLLIAVGGKPFIPSIKGSGDDVLTFTKMDDAIKLRESSAQTFVIIGAGLIGLKAAESLVKLGKNVTVVELADRVLATMADEKASEIMENVLKENSVNIILKNTVSEIRRPQNKISSVILKDGQELFCDAVIIAIGVRPNLEMINKNIKTNKGIIVNKCMETNIKDVYAAGDVAEAFDPLSNGNNVIPTWTNAYIHGNTAGYNMAGKTVENEGNYPMNVIEFFDVPIMSLGIVKADNECEVLEKLKNRVYKKLIIKNDAIIGAILINEIDRAGIINGLIRNKTNAKNFKTKLIQDELGFLLLPEYVRKQMLYEQGIQS